MNPEKYAVIGHPIEHSKSPTIHQAFARQFNKAIIYEKVLGPLDAFAATVKRLQAEGFVGANVTVPFKFEAFALCQELTDRAQAAGAVNTLRFLPTGLLGDNTDGYGLVNDLLQHQHARLAGKKILLLGAGGAAQGVVLPLLEQQPLLLTIANRSLDKAQGMAAKFAAEAVRCQTPLEVQTMSAVAQTYDVIINATSAGLTDRPLDLPAAVFQSTGLAYDMMYGRETPFMQQARAAGMQVADGLGMLVEQAAEAFYLWHGLRPDTARVIQSFRQS